MLCGKPHVLEESCNGVESSLVYGFYHKAVKICNYLLLRSNNSSRFNESWWWFFLFLGGRDPATSLKCPFLEHSSSFVF